MSRKLSESYRGVVARDGDRMVGAFHDLDDEDWQQAIALGVFVAGFIVNDVHRDGGTEEQLRELATKIVESESGWIDLEAETVARFLAAAATGDTSFSGVPREDIIGHTFVSGGHLLATYRLEGQDWWSYLDEIEAAAEAAVGSG